MVNACFLSCHWISTQLTNIRLSEKTINIFRVALFLSPKQSNLRDIVGISNRQFIRTRQTIISLINMTIRPLLSVKVVDQEFSDLYI